MRELKGIMPAIATPCNEKDPFPEDDFAALAEYLYKQGVHGLYVCGGTRDGYNTFEIMMRETGHAPYCWRRPRAVMDSETAARFLIEARPILNAIEKAVCVTPR